MIYFHTNSHHIYKRISAIYTDGSLSEDNNISLVPKYTVYTLKARNITVGH